VLYELNTGTYIEPSKLTVKDYLDRWLEDYAKGAVGKKTFERYEGIVRDYLVPELGNIVLTKLQPLHIQACYTRWRQEGRRDGREGGLSAQTVLHHHRVLSEVLHQAVRWQLVARNVAEAVEPPTAEYWEIQVLQEDEFVRLLDASEGTRLYIPILLAGTTAMRRSEVLVTGGMWILSRVSSPSIDRFRKPAKVCTSRAHPDDSERWIYSLLRRRHWRRIGTPRPMSNVLAADYQDNDLICCQDDGRVWAPSAFTSAYRDLLRRPKIPNVRFHNFRHSHATQLLRDGENPKMVSERLEAIRESRPRLTDTVTCCQGCRKTQPLAQTASYDRKDSTNLLFGRRSSAQISRRLANRCLGIETARINLPKMSVTY